MNPLCKLKMWKVVLRLRCVVVRIEPPCGVSLLSDSRAPVPPSELLCAPHLQPIGLGLTSNKLIIGTNPFPDMQLYL